MTDPQDKYIRYATVTKIQDGDSIWALIDLGFDAKYNAELRFLDVYAFESKGQRKELGLADQKSLEKLLPVGSLITVQTFKTKYGKDKKSFTRYIAQVWHNGVCINDYLKLKKQGGTGYEKEIK